MTSRDLLQVKAALDGLLWRYIEQQVEKQGDSLRRAASRYDINQLSDLLVREQMLMKANAAEDFINSLPSLINEDYKKQLEIEQKAHE